MGIMALARQWLSSAFAPSVTMLDRPPEHTFDTAPRPVDQVIAAMRLGDLGRVSRSLALSVPAVQRGRNELCSIATLPLKLYSGLDVVDAPLFRQYDPDVPNVVHLAMTIEDLALESIAWWQVTMQDFDRYPVAVRRIDPCDVKLTPPGGGSSSQLVIPGVDQTPLPPERGAAGKYVWIDRHDGRSWQPFPSALMIRFDSPNPGILSANARAVRIAVQLDRLTEMYASNPALREYFTDSDDPAVSPMNDDEIDAFLAEYGAMRTVRPFGWLPSTVKRADVQSPSPKDLTLAELQSTATIAIANGLGVDPEDLGVSTTSRTYQNEDARRRDKINRMYAPYMSAITDRLVMGDVTRRGYAPRWDLTDYLKPDPLTQAQYWTALEGLGVTDAAEIRGWAGLSGPPPAAAAPAPSSAAALHALPSQRFDGGPAHTFAVAEFAAAAPAAPSTDVEARTITGLAVPYNVIARKYGIGFRFLPGSLEYGAPSTVKHLQDHVTPVGSAVSLDDGPDGLTASLGVLSGPEGSPTRMERDQLLHDAAGGLYDGLSIGVDYSLDPADGDVTFDETDNVYDVHRATLREISTTPMPAFTDARVTRVAASHTPGGDTVDPCQHCGGRHAPGIACATFAAQSRTAPPATPATPATPVSRGTEPITLEALAAFLAAQAPAAVPAEGPTTVSPHRGPALEVREPAPYRFDRHGNLRAGSHDFSSDLFNGWSPGGGGDQAARDRAEGFLRAAFAERDFGNALLPEGASSEFAITPANVVNLNYPANRPDLYVDQLDYQYPLYAGSLKGTLDAVTPFVIPKFNSSSGLVADHVTGTEPTPGTFTATAQTITPSAVSGKVEITREAFDQGGNPQMSGLIWRQMVRGWYEALEAFVQSSLIAAAASIPDITITASSADAVLDASLASGLVPLQYVRGGDRYRIVYTQIDLFTAMVKAKDSTGRRLYPSLGAVNAVGTTDPGYNSIEAHGKLFVPSWATEATAATLTRSWMFDPDVVCLWASTPNRIDLAWRVAWVDLGIWGYKAFGVTDFTRTREVQYTR